MQKFSDKGIYPCNSYSGYSSFIIQPNMWTNYLYYSAKSSFWYFTMGDCKMKEIIVSAFFVIAYLWNE